MTAMRAMSITWPATKKTHNRVRVPALGRFTKRFSQLCVHLARPVPGARIAELVRRRGSAVISQIWDAFVQRPDDCQGETEPASAEELTRLLNAAGTDRAIAARQILPLVYDELRKLAHGRMNLERADHTLDATGLVHEAYLRLMGNRACSWANRAHFFHAAAEAMRRILIDHARAKAGPKRGGGRLKLPLDVVELAATENAEQILALDEALSRLEEEDQTAAEVVRLRFYAGLSVEEVASATGKSARTVKREWAFARAYLLRRLQT